LDKITVIKIGGSTFGSHDTTIEDIVTLQRRGVRMVIIHGGANKVTGWLARQDIPTRFVDGERVTDRETLDMVTAVLGGLVNKEIVAAINSRGGQAIGISGVDGSLIQGRIKRIEMGYTGVVAQVNPAPLEALLQAGYIPVVSSLSLYSVDRPDDAPQILNVNGDPIAGEIAAAVSAERLIFLTDVDGIRDGSGKMLDRLSPEEAEALVSSGVASGGMIPKINACIKALTTTSVTRIINGCQPHALLGEIEGQGTGTTIIKN